MQVNEFLNSLYSFQKLIDFLALS